jgi:O-antigen/teichoic acid export membrane protein
MIERLHALGRRFLLMLGGEVMQSAFAFILNISLARTLPAERYGLFAIIVLIGGFGIIYMRSLIGVPACIYIPQSRRESAALFYSVMFGSGALVVSIGGAALVAAALAPWHMGAAIPGGLFVGAWSLRYFVRMVLFAQGRAALATMCDFTYTLSATAFCAPLVWRGSGEALLQHVLLALATAHLIGAGLALAALRQPMRVSLRRTIRRRLIRLLPTMTWSIVSVTMANIQGQGAVLLLAVIAGPAAYAPIAATMAFFSPLRLAAAAMANMTQPDFAGAMARSGRRGVMEILLVSTGLIGLVCVSYGILMAVCFPTLARHVFGHRFGAAPLDLIAFIVWCIATVAVLYSVPKTLLESGQRFRGITVLAGFGALLCMPTVAILLEFVSPAWSLLGILLSEFVVLVGSWLCALAFLRHARDLGRGGDVPRRSDGVATHVRATSLEGRQIRKSGADA